MTRVGRKPLATGHVDHLAGSPRAKQRLTVILKTMSGEWTIPMACQKLGIREAHFHALRREWLQEALRLLEPKPVGRPPRAEGPPAAPQAERMAELQRRLSLAEARREVAEVLGAWPMQKKGPAGS